MSLATRCPSCGKGPIAIGTSVMYEMTRIVCHDGTNRCAECTRLEQCQHRILSLGDFIDRLRFAVHVLRRPAVTLKSVCHAHEVIVIYRDVVQCQRMCCSFRLADTSHRHNLTC